jgi:hypothetical protein
MRCWGAMETPLRCTRRALVRPQCAQVGNVRRHLQLEPSSIHVGGVRLLSCCQSQEYRPWQIGSAVCTPTFRTGAHSAQHILLLLNAAFQRRIVFDSWRDELIYRTEKVPGDPDQMNIKRPLELQNVLRKLWIGMLKNRVVKAWYQYQHGLIDEDQHAFLRGKSTATPIYTRKMALADGTVPTAVCGHGRCRLTSCI